VCQLTVDIYLFQLTVDTSILCANICVCQLTVDIYPFQLTVDTSILIVCKHLCVSVDNRYLSVSVDSKYLSVSVDCRHFYFNWEQMFVCVS